MPRYNFLQKKLLQTSLLGGTTEIAPWLITFGRVVQQVHYYRVSTFCVDNNLLGQRVSHHHRHPFPDWVESQSVEDIKGEECSLRQLHGDLLGCPRHEDEAVGLGSIDKSCLIWALSLVTKVCWHRTVSCRPKNFLQGSSTNVCAALVLEFLVSAAGRAVVLIVTTLQHRKRLLGVLSTEAGTKLWTRLRWWKRLTKAC